MNEIPIPEKQTDEHEKLKAQHNLVLRGITNQLEGEFGHLLTRETLEHYVQDSYNDLASRAKVWNHIPSFVQRFSRQRLKALAKNTGLVTDHLPEVLFICEENDGSSQMAAAIFNAQVGDGARAHSAGARPAAELIDRAVYVLHEIDIDIMGEFPKPITEEIERAADVIVTLGAHDDIPVVDGRHYEAWKLEAHNDDLEGYRELRIDLEGRITKLIDAVIPRRRPTHRAFDVDLAELESLVSEMGDRVTDLVGRLALAIPGSEEDQLHELIAADEPIDELERRIAEHVFEVIARRQPVALDLRTLLAMHDTGIHLERIADGIVDIASIASSDVLAGPPPEFSEMITLVGSMTHTALAALAGRDAELARTVEDFDEDLGGRHDAILTMLIENGASPSKRIDALSLDRASRLLKRSGEHALDIAEQAVFLVSGERVELGRRIGRPVS